MNATGKYVKHQDMLFIIALALLAYWPVSFMLFSVKNDAINYFLAMRYNTSEAIQSGHFPLWSPYINLGYPLHGDMQSGTWNPLVLLLSAIRKYDIYWLQLETILTVIIAGLSFYKLLAHFKLKRVVLLAGSAAYMLNGYITDSGQFLNWLYAAAYLPLVMLYAIRCFDHFRIKDGFYLGLSFSLMLLSAYPADVILLGYLLLAFFLFSVFRHPKDGGWTRSFIRCLKPAGTAALTFSLICLPAIISYLPFLSSIRRGNGVELDVALSNSLSPVNFLSVLTPWPTQRIGWEQFTDPLIRNCYMGIILLAFFLLYFFNRSRKTGLQLFLAGTFLFFLIFSLGKAGGLRVLSYYTLPLMDSFRHPANAKLFFLFAAQLLACQSLNHYLENQSAHQPVVSRILNALLLITGILTLAGLVKNKLPQLASVFIQAKDRTAIKSAYDAMGFFDFLLLNGLLVFITLFLVRRSVKKGTLQRILLPLLCVEMVIAAQFMLPLTYFRTSPPKTVQQILDAQPSGYPLPDPSTSLATQSAEGMNYFNEIGCLNPFNKKIGRSDYIITPANLSWQMEFWEDTLLRTKVMNYPAFYMADTVYSSVHKARFLSDTILRKAALADLAAANTGNIPAVSPGRATVISFQPDEMLFNLQTDGHGFFVLLQNHYPNWEAKLDNKPVPVLKTNHAFMGVQIPPGEHRLSFTYKNNTVLYLAIGSLLFTVTGLLYFSRRKKTTIEQENH